MFKRRDFPKSKDEPCAFAVNIRPMVITYNRYGAIFPSQNYLYTYLSECLHTQELIPITPTTNDLTTVCIIKSTYKLTRLVRIYSWCYTTAKIRINSILEYYEICLNTGCFSTIRNIEFIKVLPSITITKLTDGIMVSGIRSYY